MLRHCCSLAVAFLLAGALAAVGCQNETSNPEVSAEVAAVTSSTPDAEFSGVCGIQIVRPLEENGVDKRDPEVLECSCTLIADRIVMTAAHCVEENLRADLECGKAADGGVEEGEMGPCTADIDLRFGNSYGGGTRIALDTIELFRYYDSDVDNDDLALIRLAEDPGAFTPVTLNEAALTSGLQGETVTLVGFGATNVQLDDFGLRRRVDISVVSVLPKHITGGTLGAAAEGDEFTACFGDNGGPGFYDFGAGPVQIVVNSVIGETSCNPQARRTRVDIYLDEFIYPFVDRYVGACTLDGTCDTTGCRSEDPDCDPCLQDGVCEEDCPTRDWDCALGVFPGGDCTTDGECEEGGRCVVALDDDEYTYCNRPCDPALPDEATCPATMTCNDDNECEFTLPSPGSIEDPCDCGPGATSCENGACRSGICEEGMCTVTCTTDADCPARLGEGDPFTCAASSAVSGTNVCTGVIISGGGGFCDPNSITGRGRAGGLGGLLVLFLAVLALVYTRKRG